MPESAIPIRPPNRLRELREAADERREAVAVALDVGAVQVERWERGRVEIPTKYLRPLAARFGVSISYLLKDENGDNGDLRPAA